MRSKYGYFQFKINKKINIRDAPTLKCMRPWE